MREVLGIGTDIEETRRFQKHITNNNEVDGLIRALFTEEEIANNLAHQDPVVCFTAGFCCKESVFKAVGRSWMNARIGWQDIALVFPDPDSWSHFRVQLQTPVHAMLKDAGASTVHGELRLAEDHVTFNAYLIV